MRSYVVIEDSGYDGQEIIGVLGSKIEAMQFKDQFIANKERISLSGATVRIEKWLGANKLESWEFEIA